MAACCRRPAAPPQQGHGQPLLVPPQALRRPRLLLHSEGVLQAGRLLQAGPWEPQRPAAAEGNSRLRAARQQQRLGEAGSTLLRPQPAMWAADAQRGP